MPNPSVVSGNSNSGSFTSGTSVTVSSTGSVNAGDLQVCVLTVGGASAPSALSAPDGTWTTFLATTANTGSGLIVTAVFYKKATAAGAFSGSFSWTTTATSGNWGFFVLNQAGALLVDGTVVTAQNASGTKTSPTITPGAGKVNDTLICAIIGAVVGTDTISQPAGMTSIINIAGTASQPFFSIASLGLASSSATGTKTWTIPTSRTCLGVSFLVQQGPIWGFNVVNDAAPALPSYENRVAQRHAARSKSEFAIFPMPFGEGWQIQPPQPPRLRWERRGAILRGDDGTQGTKINFVNYGWPSVPHQPQHVRAERAGAIAIGDTGTEAKFIPPVTTPPLFDFVGFFARSRIIQRTAAATMRGEDGTESRFAVWYNFGWETQSVQPPRYPSIRQRYTATKGRSDFAVYSGFVSWAWETQPPQPRHPRTERSGSLASGDFGAYAVSAPVVAFTKWGWDIQPSPPRYSSTRLRYPGIKGRTEFGIFRNAFGWGFEPQMPPGRMAGPRIVQRGAGASGESSFAAFNLTAWAEVQSWQPPYPRLTHRGATLVIGDPGNEAKFVPPAVAVTWGFEPPPLTKRNAYRAGIFTERDVETPLINFFPFGWPVQPVQPGHPSPEKRFAGIVRGDDGTQAQQINFFPAGWQIQPHQPQHPRPERAGAIMVGEPGNEGVFSFIAPIFVPDGYNPTAFMPRVRFARAGSLARGEDGTEGLYSVWLPSGWQIQDPAQRPRRGTAGAIQEEWRGGEQQLLAATRWGFEFQSDLRRQVPRQLDQAATVLVAGTTAVTISWGDFNPEIRLPTRRRRTVDQTASFVPSPVGNFLWGNIDPAMTLPSRRRTLTRAEFHIEGQFVFVPPLALNFVVNPDNLLRRTLFNPGAAIMQFDGGWFQQRYVSVFFATSIVTQASGDTAVTAATGQTVLSNQA